MFQGIPPEGRSEVAGRARNVVARRNGVLMRQGEPAHLFGYLHSGRFKLLQAGAASEVIVRLAVSGQVLGGLGLSPGEVYGATAVALETSHVLTWERHDLEKLFSRYPVLPLNALRIQARRLCERDERYRELSTEKVPQRLARTLLRLVQPAGRRFEDGVFADVPLSRAELAELTGTTLFTVSRVLSEWAGHGILKSRRERVVIEDARVLAAIAQAPTPTRNPSA
jgi:CRP-like cAMP-binding protein